MEITSVNLIRRWPCIDKGGSPLDSALHSFRALFINIFGHFWGLRISCFSPEHLVSWDCSLCFSPEHLVQVKAETLTRPFHRWDLVDKLLEALQGNIKGELSSPDTNFMFCMVHVLAGLFFAWLILQLVQSHLLCCGGKEGRR